jgi:hypothetical protein
MFIAEKRRPPRARLIAGTRAFDLDDLRAEIPQHLRARWAGEDTAEVEEGDAVEWTGRHDAEPTPR